LVAGLNTITFGTAFPSSGYALVTLYTYNSLGQAIGYTISGKTASKFDITVGEDCTLMWRAAQVGGAYDSLPIAPSPTIKVNLAQTHEEFRSFRADAKQNEHTAIFWMGETNRLFLNKGYGLSTWQSFIFYYPRVPYLIAGVADYVDLPDGLYIEQLILLHRWGLAKRFQLLDIVKEIPSELALNAKKIFDSAGVAVQGEEIKKNVERKLQ